jgi:hypothetical protein
LGYYFAKFVSVGTPTTKAVGSELVKKLTDGFSRRRFKKNENIGLLKHPHKAIRK